MIISAVTMRTRGQNGHEACYPGGEAGGNAVFSFHRSLTQCSSRALSSNWSPTSQDGKIL
eukprot:746227-Hanusia_phi.AAC.2